MKRSVLDITKNLYRSNNRIRLDIFDLNNPTYYIFGKIGYKLSDTLYEMSDIHPENLVRLTINNVYISNEDFLIESDSNSIIIKLLKSKIPYQLDDRDTLILNASIQNA